MKILAVALLAACLAAGCQSAPPNPAAGTDAVTADAPRHIEELTDQTVVYSCPNCGWDYDRAGQCSMCNVDLVETRVAYVCPADNESVEHAGKCPRCNMNARIIHTAMAADVGGTEPDAGADPGAATGQ